MIVTAKTHHGQFREEKFLFVNTAEDFVRECVDSVGYITPSHVFKMEDVWSELVVEGRSSFGWTDFVVLH